MMVVRVIGALARPAIAGGLITASAAGGFLLFNQFQGGGGTAFERLQGDGPRLLIAEFSSRRDDVVAINPDNVSDRTTIASVDHAQGYGIFATLSPDGHAFAYTALPATTTRAAPDAPAQAAVVDTKGDVNLLAGDIDLLIPPVWSPDSNAIVVRKSTLEDDSSGTSELLLLGRDGSRETLTTWHSATVFPIAFAPDGSKLYFATLSAQGSDLYSVAPDGSGETKIAHLSDQITREWTLSPDGTELAYTESLSGQTPKLVAKRLDLASGAIAEAIPADVTASQFNPAWKDSESLTVGAVRPEGGGEAVNVDSGGGATAVTASSDSMDLPISWSPDGEDLVVRSVEGRTPFDAGASRLELVDASGSRQRISDSADTLVVGWLR